MDGARGQANELTLVRTSLRGLKLPGHVLRQTAEPVDFDAVQLPERELLGRLLFAAMFRAGGIGLAAPMVGFSSRIVVAVDEERAWLMFNPTLVDSGGETAVGGEGNLCLPGVFAKVPRPSTLTLKWRDLWGEEHEDEFEDQIARTLFHELEILDGGMFTDVADPETIVVSSPARRAARATSYVFEKPHKQQDDEVHVGPSCLTLPPALTNIEQHVLRRPAEKVKVKDFKRNALRQLIETMFQLQYEQRGVGLAAPQIGLSLKLAVIDNYGGEPLVLINPKLLDSSEDSDSQPEGCLSIPGWNGPVPRATKIKIRNHTVTGKAYDLTAEGYLARIVQHEFDHLEGVLYPDHVPASESLQEVDYLAQTELAMESVGSGDGEDQAGIGSSSSSSSADPAPSSAI